MPRPKSVSDEAILSRMHRLIQRIGPDRFTLAAAGAEVGLSASTLVQRFGTKRDLLLAADRWAVEQWVAGMDAVPPGGPALDRLIDGLVFTLDAATTPEEMANSVSLLQIALADGDFHASTRSGAQQVREKVTDRLRDAVSTGELRPGTDVETLADLVEVTYHGAMIAWAIHREGSLYDFVRERFGRLLVPYRPGD